MAAKKLAVIVLSYNRPRMLGEALSSIKGADEVIVLDDGSTFDVDQVVKDSDLDCPSVSVRKLPKLEVKERLGKPRTGAAINRAIRETKADIIAYLCDDDVFDPGWPVEIKKFFRAQDDDVHFVRATWGLFEDGKKPMTIHCQLGEHRMTMGNFAHRRSCCSEHGLWWSERGAAVPDNIFIGDLGMIHPWSSISTLPVMAGWRRLHAYNMLQFTNGSLFTPKAEEVLKRGMLE